MSRYVAVIEDTKYPLGYIKWIEGKRIDAINRAILQTGKAWPKLELPSKIKLGHYFKASFDGMQITIHKYND
jgi:hypothetical protein